MKKIFVFVLMGIFTFAFVGCGGSDEYYSDEYDDSSYEEDYEDYDDYDTENEPEGTVGQEQCLQCADNYLDVGGYSEKGLREQLEYEGFESTDIDWALDNVEVDWDEQCAQCANNYMDVGGYSASSLREQLAYEGFTDSQIEYGLEAVGY